LGNFLEPKLAQNFYSIATDWKATDWLIANCYLQEQILNNSKNQLKMRVFTLLCYRTPESLRRNLRDINVQ
jgi:hypothetical protein